MPIKSRMSLIMGQIEPEHPELFAHEFGVIADYGCNLNLEKKMLNLTLFTL